MLTHANRIVAAAFGALALLGLGRAEAQQPLPNSQGVDNPYFRVGPGLSLNQAAYNTAVLGQAFQNVPPWVYGTNPAPVGTPPYYPPYAGPLYGGTYVGSTGGTATLSTTYTGGAGASGYVGGNSMFSTSPGYSSPGSMPPYGGYYPYYQDPFSGYLSGAAQVIQAQGQFMMQQEQAMTLREQRRHMQIDTHRRILEEWVYERNLLANLPDPRDVERKFLLHRYLNDPPLTEIVTGEALNAILANIKKLQDKGGVGPTIHLDDALLADINLSNGERGNFGLLKKGGQLNWPLPLRGAAFEDDRKLFDQLSKDAVQQVEFTKKVDEGTLKRLLKASAAMHERLRESVRDLTPTQYVDAKRYLDQIDDALTSLQQPEVQNYINKKWVAKGKTIGDLVKFMGDTGLRFNGATQGDEPAYRMLQQRLAAYNMALEQQTAQR